MILLFQHSSFLNCVLLSFLFLLVKNSVNHTNHGSSSSFLFLNIIFTFIHQSSNIAIDDMQLFPAMRHVFLLYPPT